MKVKEIEAKIGTLSNPSKMPAYAWGISAKDCKTGSKLAEIEGTICNKCYANKGCYVFKVVQDAHKFRKEAIELPEWVDYMAELLTIKYKNKKKEDKYHRWFDSGDLQSLADIPHAYEGILLGLDSVTIFFSISFAVSFFDWLIVSFLF